MTEPTDDELFNEAVSDEALVPDDTIGADAVVDGKLVDPEPKDPEPVKAEADKPTVDDNAAMVPSWRVREINEEKRTLVDRLAAFEAEKLQWQRQPKEPVKEPEEPDPLLDPKGYKEFVLNQTREVILSERREESLQRAHATYKDEFQQAYAAAQKQIDPVLRARMQSSRDPGETLIKWYREGKTRAEVGDDLTAYKQRLREEALKDPEFRKAAMEAWREDASPSVNGRPRVNLAPSLSGVSRAAIRASESDVSDEQLIREVTGTG